ncbi:MAG: hypothetical protein Q7K71_02125 [Candidatus Omnitrophota bacterium]|nr:hypothetical protein [Candidatus Omnitrophota bacterium]
MKSLSYRNWKKISFTSLLFMCLAVFEVHAEEAVPPVYVTMMPFHFAAVKGDTAKFRQLNWIKDGYTAGLKNVSFDRAVNGKEVSFEGHSILQENDNGVDLLISEQNFGYLKMDYQSYRKYYDNKGGVYQPFTALRLNKLEDDLKLDIQHFFIELGSGSLSEPGMSISYERSAKDGRKSRLAWTAVKESGTTRNIGPSWQDIEAVTDTLSLKGNTEIAGVRLAGEQKFSYFHEDSLREEKLLTTGTALTADNKMRRQWQSPQTDLLTTTLKGDKWFLNDKNYLSLAYRYANLDNSELENILEYKKDGTLFNYTNPKSAINATSNTSYNDHIWTGNYVSNITSTLNFISKFKTEVISKRGSSTYPHDDDANAAPNGIINTTDVSTMENKVFKLGESASLRYNAIPHTTLYTEIEGEQTRNWLTEERDSIAGESAAATGEQLARETLTHISKTVWTIGARIIPSKTLNMTMQYKHKWEDNDYDDIIDTPGSLSKSAFIDDMRLKSDDVGARISWKPFSKIEAIFRYKLSDNIYLPRFENQVAQKSKMLSNVFTYDLNLQPIDPWFLTLSFSQDSSKVSTPAASNLSPQLPGFTSNVNSFLASSSYVIDEKLNFTNTYQYSIADNFADLQSSGYFYGASFKRYDIGAGLQWSPKKDLTIEPHYTYYYYADNKDAGGSNYSAHAMWLDAKFNW